MLMRRSTIVSFLLFLITFTPLSAQNIIKGVIIDAENKNPLRGANIKQVKTTNGTATNSEGFFTLKLQASAPSKIQITFIGYKSKTVDVKGNENSLRISLTPAPYKAESMLISAVRASESSPVTQTTIDKQNLEKVYVGQDPVFAIEELSPSILSHSESGSGFANYSLMRMRGIDQTRINFTLNGVPLNDMISQGVFFSNFTDFGNSVQSVQVQRGVGTSTNGTASYAGSINFESQRIKRGNPEATINFTGGSFNSYRAGGELQTGTIKDKFGIYTRFSKTLSQGYKHHSGTNSTSFFFTGGYFGDNHVLKITSFFGRTKNELAYLPVLIDKIKEDPKTNPLNRNDEDDFTQELFQLEHVFDISKNISLNSSVYYGGAGGDFPFGFTGSDGSLVQQNFRLENDHYGLMSSLTYQPTGDLDITAGFHTYRFNRINEEAFVPNLANPYYSDDSRKDEISMFAKAEYRVENFKFYGDLQVRNVWLDLNPDKNFLRNSGVTDQSLGVPLREWTFVNPKIGATYFISDNVNIYASFGRSGREPTRTDILGTTNINQSNLEFVQDEGSVDAEYVNDLEGGIRIETNRFQSKINGFFMDFDDEISATGDFITAGFVQLRQNIEESHRVGVEFSWNWQPTYKLTLSGNTTFMESNIDRFSPGGSNQSFSDVDAILSPEWLHHSQVGYQLTNWLQLTFSGEYTSDSFLELTNQPDLKMPSYFRLDAGINLSFSDRLSGNISINNLSDELYFTDGAPVDSNGDGSIDGPGFLVQPPLHVFAEFKIHI